MDSDKGAVGKKDAIAWVDPFRCRMWALHDRLDEYVTEDSCKQEIESFDRHGQFVPVLGRPVRNDPDVDLELIYGARRLFVARHLNKPLGVKIREISDREALIAMDVENRQRRDVSAYERGLSYARWIRKGHFASQDEIARTLGISASQVSRLLKLARLPSVILSAFNTPTEITESWGLELLEAWEDESRRELIAKNARWLLKRSPRPPARQVYAQLTATTDASRRVAASGRDEVVRSVAGVPLYRVRRLNKSVILALPTNDLAPATLDEILREVAGILERRNGRSPKLRVVSHTGEPPTMATSSPLGQ
jgi:ParB family chromosome partitioning protein